MLKICISSGQRDWKLEWKIFDMQYYDNINTHPNTIHIVNRHAIGILIVIHIFTEGKATATAYDCKFIETSVGINHNVDELLVGLLTQIRLKLENPEKTRFVSVIEIFVLFDSFIIILPSMLSEDLRN